MAGIKETKIDNDSVEVISNNGRLDIFKSSAIYQEVKSMAMYMC